MDNQNISEQEAASIMRQFNEGRQTIHSFFTKVIQSKDTTKTGNLTEEELGEPRIPQRTMKELKVFCENICDEKEWGTYFDNLAELQTSTSLSKDGFLMRLAVTSKKELADVTPRSKRKNKGWFKKTPSEGAA